MPGFSATGVWGEGEQKTACWEHSLSRGCGCDRQHRTKFVGMKGRGRTPMCGHLGEMKSKSQERGSNGNMEKNNWEGRL